MRRRYRSPDGVVHQGATDCPEIRQDSARVLACEFDMGGVYEHLRYSSKILKFTRARVTCLDCLAREAIVFKRMV